VKENMEDKKEDNRSAWEIARDELWSVVEEE